MKNLKKIIFILLVCISVSCSKNETPEPNKTAGAIDLPTPETRQVSTFAGSAVGFLDGAGTAAQFNSPEGISFDTAGNLYVADSPNNKIRKISPAGIVTTLAGSTYGFANGNSTVAKFSGPSGVAIDVSGNVYVSDTENHKIRKINPNGIVTTLAGSTLGYAEGTGSDAQFHFPRGLALDASGNILVADVGNDRIRKVSPTGVVSTFAGGTQGFANGTGVLAQFDRPFGVAIDASGNMYVADRNNNKIRKISPNAEVTTLAGSTLGFADGTGVSSQFYYPYAVAVDASGNIYVADRDNHRIRKISPTGLVSTLAGGIKGFADGIVTSAKFDYPSGVAVDISGNVFVADQLNNKIRKITRN